MTLNVAGAKPARPGTGPAETLPEMTLSSFLPSFLPSLLSFYVMSLLGWCLV